MIEKGEVKGGRRCGKEERAVGRKEGFEWSYDTALALKQG